MRTYAELATTETLDWLMSGDASVRYGVERYLLGADAETLERERSFIARSGWCARLLAEQDRDGRWAGALYSPKYTSTHYTLLTLRRLNLPPTDPKARAAALILLDAGFREDHGVNYSSAVEARAETCISGMCLSMFSYFGLEDDRIRLLAEHLIEQQMPDGGWNCQRHRGATHGSFHTTTSTLEGLSDYLHANLGADPAVRSAISRGQDFLLRHRLFKSDHTGAVVSPAMTRFPFPPMWQHDVLRALDHFASTAASRDERASDAIGLVLSKQRSDGRFPQYRGPSGNYFFPFETVGRASRINTLRVLRVLKWWAE